MATNKAKRSIHLAQPGRRSLHPQPAADLLPVKANIYRAIAELNGGFEKTIHDLKNLQQINFFRSERLAAMHDVICGLRAQTNREFLSVLGERETANAGHFERLSSQRENKSPKSPFAG